MSADESDSDDLDRSVRELLRKQASRIEELKSDRAAVADAPSTSVRRGVTLARRGKRKPQSAAAAAAATRRKAKSKQPIARKPSGAAKLNPAERADYLKPLKKGWVREMVYRAVVSKSASADIYYTSPDGVKFRSGKEIERFFEAHPEKAAGLRAEYFTFKRVLLGWDGPEEFERQAGSVGYAGHKRNIAARLAASAERA